MSSCINLVSPKLFNALQTVDITELSKFSQNDLRPVLPCLVRMSLISPVDTTKICTDGRKEILTLLSGIELVNSIVALLSIDFHALEVDVKREQQLRQKIGSAHSDSILVQSLQNGLTLEFERSDSTRRLRLVLSELLFISSQVQRGALTGTGSETSCYIKQSELFDNSVYIPEICDVISIALAELPALLSIQDIVETLLHVSHGPDIICWTVANSPDSFTEVCTNLISNAERQEEENGGGRIRMQALTMLCQMNPSQTLAVRAKCVEMCRMPALTITLSLEHSSSKRFKGGEGDTVAFVSGLLLGNDQQRNRESSSITLQCLREELLYHLQGAVLFSVDNKLPPSSVVQASSLLRLYCALRGIAGVKFQEDEVSLIVQLLTSHPPPSPAGVRFVSIGLCMLIACPSLIALQEHETKCVEWVQWLVQEEAYFESASGVTSSFGEMLLLMAIHFHSNQLSAICELVCSTVGMKVPIRHNNMTRMKQIFTQEIFTEQVVTSHAVKVPVTANLSANIPGFLPVHCIHQLLKSRAFTKHKVPIKDWIYRQICSSEAPLHPVLPALVEVYVNSILVPSAKVLTENTNQPMDEEEIRRVFRNSLSFKERNVGKPGYPPINATSDSGSGGSLTAQLLLLYYVLHYEDVRLSNMQAYIKAGRDKIKSYGTEFLSELPIKYLLQQAQRDQQSYAGLFSPLLRLLATHFPHLSLVDDWMSEDVATLNNTQQQKRDQKNSIVGLATGLTEAEIDDGLSKMATCPLHTERLLNRMLSTPPTKLWPYAHTIIKHIHNTLELAVPRYIQELFKQMWLKLNTVLPRSLWVMTINALRHEKTVLPDLILTQENVVLDPLQVLRCDDRVFRCASILRILLRVLQACLAASRSQLSQHLLDHPLISDKPSHHGVSGHGGQLSSDGEREELKSALVATQESVAAQILLEACLETKEDRSSPGQMWALHEVRSVICSYLHQVFIADPALAKLVHFQGYPRELLPVTVPGIPSMHICLDFIPELLSQPSLEKQVFAVDLVSHLALQYSLPKSMSVARLAVNTLMTLLTVLSSSNRLELFQPSLPALVRICEAFPPLVDDVVALLTQLGRISMAEASRSTSACLTLDEGYNPDLRYTGVTNTMNDCLVGEIQYTFAQILERAVLKIKIY
ncbi:integrator complex subunit 2 isoform X2 [Lycorma delicatula]|uniref:integrator complex subunit 2 isoform X2 n=1 Tax=Lycorma delicatula TaxID=130591 RepID=UPI003F50E31C